MNKKNTKGAMEMSVGTIVTIVLLMSVLVLGIFFISKIFNTSNDAVDAVSVQLTSQINQMFSDGKASKLAVYPPARQITVKKGTVPPKGFVFSVYNNGVDQATFNFSVEASDVSKCGNTMTTQIANSYLTGGQGSFPLGPGNSLENPRLVTFTLTDNTPPCTVVYNINVDKDGVAYSTADIQVTFQ